MANGGSSELPRDLKPSDESFSFRDSLVANIPCGKQHSSFLWLFLASVTT